ncbi:hypothetical protein [Nonomuraea sp. NPDC049028]|uniref:hypothetical protein n=1 Tax=Nonomuraea sp. NPDC049028 TaxID=3364348 RepID=UPI00371B1B27
MSESSIDPDRLIGYLASRGWRREGAWRGASVWEADDGRLLIPTLRQYPDDDELLQEAVARLATIEDRPEGEVLLDIAEPMVDTIDIRTLPGTPSGTIPLLSGAKAVDGICELLDTSARTVEEGSHLIFSGRRSAAVQEFLGGVRLGASRPGSYVFTARVPLVLPPQLSLFEEEAPVPFGRQVLKTMDTALRAAHTACTRVISGTAAFDVFDEYVDQGVSADLCEAVSALAGYGIDRPFEVSLSWARGLTAPPSDPLRFTATMATVLSQAGKQLQELSRIGQATINGVIEDLHDDGVEPPRIKVRGELQTSTDVVARAIWVVLSRADYQRAGDAHYRRLRLRVAGRLSTAGKRLEMRPDSSGLEILS